MFKTKYFSKQNLLNILIDLLWGKTCLSTLKSKSSECIIKTAVTLSAVIGTYVRLNMFESQCYHIIPNVMN